MAILRIVERTPLVYDYADVNSSHDVVLESSAVALSTWPRKLQSLWFMHPSRKGHLRHAFQSGIALQGRSNMQPVQKDYSALAPNVSVLIYDICEQSAVLDDEAR